MSRCLQGDVQRPLDRRNIIPIAVVLRPETEQPISIDDLHRMGSVILLGLYRTLRGESSAGVLGELQDQLAVIANRLARLGALGPSAAGSISSSACMPLSPLPTTRRSRRA